jgi:adenylate cyclase
LVASRQVADRLPDDDPDRISMRIAPRTLLCAHEYRIRSGRADTAFSELKELCGIAGDERSVAIALAGLTLATNLDAGPREASDRATELIRLLESLGDPELTVSLSIAPMTVSLQGGRIAAALRLAQRVIELTGGRPTQGELMTISPLASAMSIRGTGRWSLGLSGWREDFDRYFEIVATIPPAFRSGTFWHVYLYAIPNGVLIPEPAAIGKAAEIHSAAEQFGEEITVDLAKAAQGITLVYREGSERDAGARLLQELHETARRKRVMIPQNVPLIYIHVAREKARLGDGDGAIELARTVFDNHLRSGESMWLAMITAVLVESLLQRGFDVDLREARDATAKLAAVPTEPRFVLNEIWLLRLWALLAQADGVEVTYRDYRDRYRKMAADLDFEGHIAWAAEMV